MSAGKGDKPRPVDKREFDKNFEQISWEKKDASGKMIKSKGGKIKLVYK